jgi:hypothetical protein
MKFNKWTLGLAAVGAVSLASVAQAEEKTSSVMTAVSSTVLSGYVDTSVHWNPGTGNSFVPAYSFNTPGKADGFNLDAVKITLQKPLDESEWAAGYNVDLFFGPDANFLSTSPAGGLIASDFAIKQAYVSLRTPLGNGIDWKLGVFDSIIGYESTEAGSNPNYTRSYGYTLEPTTLTGLLGTYKVNDLISVAAGIADTTGPTIGGESIDPHGVVGGPFSIGRANPPKAESYKTYMGSVSLTAPNDWGFISGSTLYGGFINGWSGGTTAAGVQTSLYAGATLNTPITNLKTGISYDYLGTQSQGYAGIGNIPESWANDVALYASFQATEKLSIHGRAEYLWASKFTTPILTPNKVFAFTGTVQYDLWKNVISRLEFRWDHQASGQGAFYGGNLAPAGFGNAGTPTTVGGLKRNSYLFAANIIYKF